MSAATMRRGLTALAVVLGVSSAAQAQYVQSYQLAPLYPYATQPQYIYAPQQYMAEPAQPYARPRAVKRARASVGKTDPALVEEWRRKHPSKPKDVTAAIDTSADADVGNDSGKKFDKKIDKTIVVREKPIVRKHYRVVDDPPQVVTREIDENGVPLAPESRAQVAPSARVIHAEAEVTILGPDNMSIRLYRKRDGRDANAKAVGKTSKN